MMLGRRESVNIGKRIQKYRKERKITQVELGELINRSLRSVMKYEQGEVVPSIALLEEIAEVLGVDVSLLLDDETGKTLNDFLKIGDNIKKYRESKGITQKDMAENILNIPRSTYSNYENNNRVPSLELLNRIAEVLKVDIETLIKGETPTTNISNITVSVGLEGMDQVKEQINELNTQLDKTLEKYKLIKEATNENTPI